MIDFPNLPNLPKVSQVNRAKRQYTTVKKETESTATSQSVTTDVVQISADAAMKGKLSSFALALSREAEAVNEARIENLKAQYEGDHCPISSRDLAAAIIARIRTEAMTHE